MGGETCLLVEYLCFHVSWTGFAALLGLLLSLVLVGGLYIMEFVEGRNDDEN